MKEIRLENFRCYTDLSVSFRSGVNLFVGDNATGKTSILKACKYVLSSFFSGFSDDNTKWVNPGNEDFRQIETDGILLQERPIHIHFNTDDTIEYLELLRRPESLFLTDEESETYYTLTKNTKKNSRSLTSGIREYKDYAAALMQSYITENGQQKALPLFANFSTEDIHATRKIDVDKFKAYSHKPSFGYYECLEGDGFFPYWIKRLLVLQEGRENHPEIAIVRRAVQEALGGGGCRIIQDMQVRPNQKKVYYIYMDGREVEAGYLSDGYRRLVNIVTDLAFRCALLNRGIYNDEACARTKGTVLIDEVDLHLHPTLQSRVLKGLRHAFPQLQFIVSSHAPMVMSGVESNEENVIYKLDFSAESGYGIAPVVTYGMDLSTLTEVVLNQTPRVAEVDLQLTTLFELIDDEKVDEATILLKDMKEKYGGHIPELAQAEAMLNCVIPA